MEDFDINYFTKDEEINMKAQVIEVHEHKINKEKININALKVIKRLNHFGFEGFIVGGAIRDYLFNKIPKDFDVVTNATPRQLRKIFCNSKIIGRRFKLTHIFFKNTIIETATYRAEISHDKIEKDGILIKRDNIYGTIEDDVKRRDFSINALYYDPNNETIIDFVNGYQDVLEKNIITLKKEKISFLEDPVRMLRAVKYATLLNCNLDKTITKSLKKYAKEISKCSPSRLYEEINKIFSTGYSHQILDNLKELKLLKYLIPFFYHDLLNNKSYELLKTFLLQLDQIDRNDQDFQIEFYWMVLLYKRLQEKFDGSAKTLNKEDILNFYCNNLTPLRVPKKICISLSKITYLFYQLKKFQKDKNLNQQKLKQILLLFKIFSIDEKTIEFWKNVKLRKKRRLKKKKNYYKKNIKAKKIVETKKIF